MKQHKGFYLSMCIILASGMNLFAQDVQNSVPEEFVIHEDTQTITINNNNFSLFLSGIVHEAVQAGKQTMLSEALLRCYECMMDEQKECFIKDLQEAMPELLMIASECCQRESTSSKHCGSSGRK